MRSLVLRIMQVLRLTRVSQGFAAAGNLWFVILWTRSVEPERVAAAGTQVVAAPLWVLLAGATLAGAGTFTFGAVLNDLMDVHRDRALRRDRPMASGGVSGRAGAVGLTVSLTLAVAGSTVFGTGAVLITLALSCVILLFNLFGKFVPAVGLILLCVIYAGHLLMPNPRLLFLWPVWVVMTHAVLTAGLTHALERKSPPISARALVLAALGWVLASIALLVFGATRSSLGGGLSWWPSWVGAGGAALCVALAVIYAITIVRRIRSVGPGPRAAEKITRYGASWLPLYGVAWLIGNGAFSGSLLLLTLWGLSLVGITVLRETYGLAEQPIGFRR